jgi:hypothetical protein
MAVALVTVWMKARAVLLPRTKMTPPAMADVHVVLEPTTDVEVAPVPSVPVL